MSLWFTVNRKVDFHMYKVKLNEEIINGQFSLIKKGLHCSQLGPFISLISMINRLERVVKKFQSTTIEILSIIICTWDFSMPSGHRFSNMYALVPLA